VGDDGRLRRASPDAVLAVLAALGVPIRRLADAPDAERSVRLRAWRRPLDPCRVWWEGRSLPVHLRRPADGAWTGCACRLRLEDGDVWRWELTEEQTPVVRSASVEGERFEVRNLRIETRLPAGVHRLEVEADGRRLESVILAAPRTAFAGEARAPLWGTIMPLYALHSRRSWGSGDLTDLSALIRWTGAQGGAVVGTLPLLAGFSAERSDPSPYLPVSRLFWNEMYADLESAPGLAEAPEVRAELETADGREALRRLRSGRLLEWPAAFALRRRLLDGLARHFFTSGGEGSRTFQSFLGRNPQAREYARFRAACERRARGGAGAADWRTWSRRARDGKLAANDYEAADVRRHLYAQWLMDAQFTRVGVEARERGVRLYLDLPLGVHPAGYDAWREQRLFVREAETGAPPDAFFAGGQTWDTPPPHPERQREDGYRYLRRVLRFQMRHAGILRVDHVIGLHRQFWVAKGMSPAEGVYVRYPSTELYALLTLESRRSECELVGEDLGTVPPALRPAMRRHGLRRSWVVGLELTAGKRISSKSVPPGSVAALDTHDTPTFASTWEGLTGACRRASGLPYERSVALGACLTALGESGARLVLVNLEDLWGETEPQNVPGSRAAERPNWRQRGRLSLEEFSGDPEVATMLAELNRSRRRACGAAAADGTDLPDETRTPAADGLG